MAEDLSDALIKLDTELREGLAALEPTPRPVAVLFEAYENELTELRPILQRATKAATLAADSGAEADHQDAAREMGDVNERVAVIGELIQAIGREVKHHVVTRTAATDSRPKEPVA